MFRVMKSALACASMLVGLAAFPASAAAEPWIDFGDVFYVALRNDVRSNVGHSRLEFRATVRERSGGSIVVRLAQQRPITSFDCRSSTPAMHCSSESFASTDIDPARPVEITAVHVNDTTDAVTVLYQATLPVYAFWDWTGMENDRPAHVEQRALRLDGALGVVLVRQLVADRQASPPTFQNGIALEWWDATPSRSNLDQALRCRVNDGEWVALGRGGSTGENDQALENRVRMANGEVREGDGESLYYQRYRLVIDDPGFWVAGIPNERVHVAYTRRTSPAADGRWTCELRRREGTERRVVRRFELEVRGGELVPHPATRHLRQSMGTAIVPVGFSADAPPASFDPAEVRRGFFGMAWPDPSIAPLLGALPAAVTPRFTAPAGQGRGRGERGGRRR